MELSQAQIDFLLTECFLTGNEVTAIKKGELDIEEVVAKYRIEIFEELAYV